MESTGGPGCDAGARRPPLPRDKGGTTKAAAALMPRHPPAVAVLLAAAAACGFASPPRLPPSDLTSGATPRAPPLPPLHPAPPADLQVATLARRRALIMRDSTGFLRDPSSPIQAPDGTWHAWAVWVPPVYGTEGWSGYIKHFHSSTLDSNWTNAGFALNHSTDPLAFDHLGMCSPGAQYDPAEKKWYLFYTGATPEGTTGYPPRAGGSPMDNLSAQGVAVSESPFGPWRRLGVVAPGGLAWAADRKGGVSKTLSRFACTHKPEKHSPVRDTGSTTGTACGSTAAAPWR